MLSCAFALSCGGGQKPDGGAAGGTPKADCEAGRCLEDIASAVKQRRGEARACYDAKPETPRGRIIINFEIDPEGAVIEASQSSQDDQITDAEVVTCVSDVIKTIKFAKSAAGKNTRAYHTFEFVPRKGGGD